MCENETNAQVITRKQLAVVIFYHSMHNADLGWPLTTLFVAVMVDSRPITPTFRFGLIWLLTFLIVGFVLFFGSP